MFTEKQGRSRFGGGNGLNYDNWGLTEKGFYRPTYVELLNFVEYRARELFGDKINLTVRSPLGLFLRIIAWVWDLLFSLIEDVYNSRFIDTAAGDSLYNLGKTIGMSLICDTKSTGYIKIRGTPGVKIPAGFLVSTYDGLQFTVMDNVTIRDDGEVSALIRAVEAGPEYNVVAGTIKMIVNPASVNGINEINNDAETSGGRWTEKDHEFRSRYYKSVDYMGGVNADAIRSAILNDVGGVASTYVYENDSDEYDENYQLPPHSIEVVVHGGLDEQIAAAIYNRRAGGIQTVGNTSISILTTSGQVLKICFSRPVTKKIYVKINQLKTDSNYIGDDQLKRAVINYIGDNTIGGLEIGEDVIYMQLPGVISAVPGVIDFELSIGTDGETYDKNNITIGLREKAIVSEGTVVIL